ncbi:MAG TPA: hypothetical protein PKA77_05680 [Chitinophagaceae bacterium]|jgi:hypothetical protein|nr:hypothetical protein [Chitinophagaceae bacterium]HMU57357.1 hypothetical protein [Chitinophagaceae bacterium]
MLTIHSLKPGDIVRLNDEGVSREGTVVETNTVQHLAMVHNGIQEFWFRDEDIQAIPLDEEQLVKFGFIRQEDNGGVRYLRDSFRVHLPEKGNFSNFEMWWREDRRHFHHQLAVHEFQNMYLDMTKVPLNRPELADI